MAKKVKVVEVLKDGELTADEARALREVVNAYAHRADLLRGPVQISEAEAQEMMTTMSLAHLTPSKRARVKSQLLARWVEFGEVEGGGSHPRWLAVQIRCLAGISTTELCRGAGVSESTVGGLERARSLCDALTLYALWSHYRTIPGMGWLHMEHFIGASCAELRELHADWAKSHPALDLVAG